jgi:hypothetical protein
MKLSDLDPEKMVELTKLPGYSIVSNQILNEGLPIMYMYRDSPIESEDSGWRFLSGKEDQDYLDEPSNSRFIGLNTVANMDRAVLPHLNLKKGTELERQNPGDEFKLMEDE